MRQPIPHIDQIIELCLKKQNSGFIHLYNLFYKPIYNSCLRILKSPIDAEDIMQETFMTSFEKLHTFKKEDGILIETQLEKWLKRIAINKSINFLKKNYRHEFYELEIVEDNEEINQSDIDEINNSNVKLILNAIQKLNPKYRTAISLHLIEGYDYEEMAEILQLSYQNVRTIVSRAKSQVINAVKNEKI